MVNLSFLLLPFICLGAGAVARPLTDDTSGEGVPVNDPGNADVVPGQYIVSLKTGLSLDQHIEEVGAAILDPLIIVRSDMDFPDGPDEQAWYSATLNDTVLSLVQANQDVDFIEHSMYLSLDDTSSTRDYMQSVNGLENPTATDHIAQPHEKQATTQYNLVYFSATKKNPNLKTEGYNYVPKAGLGVVAFIIDTGVNDEVDDLKFRVVNSRNFSNATDASDQTGHGTHVASICAGTKYGTSKNTNIYNLKVFNKGEKSSNDIIARAVRFAYKQVETSINSFAKGAVINMSLSGPGHSQMFENEVNNAYNAGLPVIVSAGNNNDDASKYQPAGFNNAFAVASAGKTYKKSGFSNYGSDVDIICYGENIVGADTFNDSGSVMMSGTSQAAPAVAGFAATVLQFEGKTAGARTVYTRIQGNSQNFVTGFNSATPKSSCNNGYLRAQQRGDNPYLGYPGNGTTAA